MIFAIVCNAIVISTHAPAGGATPWCPRPCCRRQDFYSRPCGRGDPIEYNDFFRDKTFLLTPLREGRQNMADGKIVVTVISTHAPAGGATGCQQLADLGDVHFYSRPCGRGDVIGGSSMPRGTQFLLTPLREGRHETGGRNQQPGNHFYSRPCGRGDEHRYQRHRQGRNFYSRPCGRGDAAAAAAAEARRAISTHAPAGGATSLSV